MADRRDVLIRQLQGALGGNHFSDVRSVTHTFGAGVDTVSTDVSGIATPVGSIVVAVTPASHWGFAWFPRGFDIVVNNSGVSQDVTFMYIVVGQ